MWLLLTRTRWGALVRAATQDREMVSALGVDQARLFTSVFFVGAALAGLGGALQIPREPANLELDLSVIADAFVVTVVGGLGSIGGAFLAAILIGVAKAFCIGIGTVHLFGVEFVFSKLTLVVEFLIMGVVLVLRPYGLLGRPPALQRATGEEAPPLTPPRWQVAAAWIVLFVALPLAADRYVTVLATDIACFALFAVSLHFIMGAGRHGVVRPCRLFRSWRLCPPRCCSSAPACRWRRRCSQPRYAPACSPWSMAGSACACRASISPC
jgi:branched-chain amino acid transport system permease protein